MHRANPPSLRRRLIVQIGLMIVGLLLLGGAAIVGIDGLHNDFGNALTGYQQLRTVYEIGRHATSARVALNRTPPDEVEARAELRSALLRLETSNDLKDSSPPIQKLKQDLTPAPAELTTACPARSAIAEHGRNGFFRAAPHALAADAGHRSDRIR